MRITERLGHESGRDYALRIIKDNIISLELAPLGRVNDREIAAELGLSRTPVREALLELAKVDIIYMYPQRASIIAPIDYDMMEEAYAMREILECAVVERCCAETALPVMLYVFAQNTGALGLYQRLGFTITEQVSATRCILRREAP